MSRPKAYFMNGGQGRVICSLPAFEKLLEKDDDFIIVCESGTDFYKGHPKLQERAFDVWHKRLFEDYLKDRDCISPEPYRVWEYYNQQCSLSQAFDIIINNEGIRELPSPKIYFNKVEIVTAFNIIEEIKSTTGHDKVLIFQPFGRSAQNMGEFIIDPTSRSFHLQDTVRIINELKKDYAVVLMSEFPIAVEENNQNPVAIPQIPDIRVWAAMIDICDHFLGCDSLGQHIAKAVDKSVTSVIGSTFPINISYPNDSKFDVIDIGEENRKYSPIRLTIEEHHERHNDETMELNDEKFNRIITSVKKGLGKPKKYTGNFKPIEQHAPGCSHNTVPSNQPAQILNRSGK